MLLQESDRRWLAEFCRSLRPEFEVRDTLQIQTKIDFDFVTSKDVSVQQKVETALSLRYPEILFWGEESEGDVSDFSRPTWILDPIDGTTNFIFQRRYSCLSLALAWQNEVVFGLIYDPYADEVFWAQKGEGAYVNGEKIHFPERILPKDSLLIASSGSANKKMAWKQMTLLRALQQEVIDLRISGSSALNLAYLAAGRGSLMVSGAMKPWDMAAGLLMIQEAGGCCCDYDGTLISGLKTTSVLAGPQNLIDWVLLKIKALSGKN